jgi:DNA-directed RNA polymerase III subunit RPC1
MHFRGYPSSSEMHLDVTVADIAGAIWRNKKLKICPGDVTCINERIFVQVAPDKGGKPSRGTNRSRATTEDAGSDLLLRANQLKRLIPAVAISGYPEATRAIIQTSETNEYTVLVEGYGLRDCMTTEGVVGRSCTSNSVMEVLGVLGIEAARTTIAHEIGLVMSDMGIDPRHMALLADVMIYKGEVLGITRFGLSKMRDSVLQLASFEKTPDHLFEAAAGMKSDSIEGVSESIIMGQIMKVGTGSFRVVRELNLQAGELQPKPTVFEDAWKWNEREKRKMRDVVMTV